MLEGLYASALKDSNIREQGEPLSHLERRAIEQQPAIDALAYLAKSPQIRVIAEIKRASPSRGDLATIENVASLATTYEQFGASAISVLTETRSFKGSLDDLIAVRRSVSIPILRKDFISTEYQVFEARAAGADIVLLIAAGLAPNKLRSLKALVEQLGMTAFIETHDEREVALALDTGVHLLGINARDLSTFQTDRSLFKELISTVPDSVITVAESAVRNAADVKNYRSAGADAVLVGEALVTGNASQLLREFTGV